jgi:hypothetical protein
MIKARILKAIIFTGTTLGVSAFVYQPIKAAWPTCRTAFQRPRLTLQQRPPLFHRPMKNSGRETTTPASVKAVIRRLLTSGTGP